MARQLAGAGVPVVAVARRGDRLATLQAEFPIIEILAADLTTPEGVAAVVARVGDGTRPLDLVVNNAGFGTSGRFVELAPDRLSKEIALNIDALMRISHAAVGPMVGRGRGWLLNVSSVAGFQAAPGLATYAATKSFVTTFSEALHEELRGTGVVVTALCPGLTRTEFQSISSSSDRSARFPALAWMTPDAVARRGLADCARGRALSIPGPLNRALVVGSSGMPRSVVRRLLGRLGHSTRSTTHN